MRRLAHIVNPVAVRETSDLFIAQPITFQSMRVARDFAADSVEVGLYTAQYPEDHAIIPEWFIRTPDLRRSVLDIGRFTAQKKLPLIGDILQRLYEASDAEYFIYTNVDIGLQPQFYAEVNRIIGLGYDAFIINRRTLPARYRSIADLPAIYADRGEAHPGYDCFVFRRDALPNYVLDNVCIGALLIGVVLAANLVCNARRFREFADLHLTFHIGDDGDWKRRGADEYFLHNQVAGETVLNRLAPRFDLRRLPKVGLPNLAEYFEWLKAGGAAAPSAGGQKRPGRR